MIVKGKSTGYSWVYVLERMSDAADSFRKVFLMWVWIVSFRRYREKGLTTEENSMAERLGGCAVNVA